MRATPICLSSALTIASVLVRVALLAVHDQRNCAGKPEQDQIAEFEALGALGPPVQCFLRIAMALPWL